MRGTLKSQDSGLKSLRFIPAACKVLFAIVTVVSVGSSPAHAGNTAHGENRSRLQRGTVPRMRVRVPARNVIHVGYGSSPRAGNTWNPPRESINRGSSPRVRGDAPTRPRASRQSTVHPTCGEHSASIPYALLFARFIPHAGNTTAAEGEWRGSAVHPRVRGTHRRPASR